MEPGSHRSDRPLWVRITLFGASGRAAALSWLRMTIGLAIAVIAVGLGLGALLFGIGQFGILFGLFLGVVLGGGGGLAAAALSYWSAIRWVDRHDGWNFASPEAP